ncbi:MAG: YceI family protein [Lacibacter sp.]
MKKQFILLILIFLVSYVSRAQDMYITRNGQVTFFSTTPVEDIRAVNNEASSVINTKTGAMQFIVLIKGFQFKKTAMQEHFNRKDYMDSDNFPKSEFKGTIIDLSKVDFKKDGNYPVTVEGNLTMHGVTNKLKTSGVISVKEGRISSTSKFKIKLADYKISVPAIVASKVADVVEVTVTCSYDVYQPKS